MAGQSFFDRLVAEMGNAAPVEGVGGGGTYPFNTWTQPGPQQGAFDLGDRPVVGRDMTPVEARQRLAMAQAAGSAAARAPHPMPTMSNGQVLEVLGYPATAPAASPPQLSFDDLAATQHRGQFPSQSSGIASRLAAQGKGAATGGAQVLDDLLGATPAAAAGTPVKIGGAQPRNPAAAAAGTLDDALAAGAGAEGAAAKQGWGQFFNQYKAAKNAGSGRIAAIGEASSAFPRGGLGMAGRMGAAVALPMLGNYLAENYGDEGGTIDQLLAGAGAGAGMGALFGPWGALAGGVIGGGANLLTGGALGGVQPVDPVMEQMAGILGVDTGEVDDLMAKVQAYSMLGLDERTAMQRAFADTPNGANLDSLLGGGPLSPAIQSQILAAQVQPYTEQMRANARIFQDQVANTANLSPSAQASLAQWAPMYSTLMDQQAAMTQAQAMMGPFYAEQMAAPAVSNGDDLLTSLMMEQGL